MTRIGFREAIGMKIAIAVLRDLIHASMRESACLDADRALWLLDELDRFADRVVREELGAKAMEIGRYVTEDVLRAERNATASLAT